jgi:P-type Cu2+ transporter
MTATAKTAAVAITAGNDAVAYVHDEPGDCASLHLVVENMHCGGCVNVIEKALKQVDGVVEVRANLTTKRLFLRWSRALVDAPALVAAIAARGYHAAPFDPYLLISDRDEENKHLLRAMAVAGFAAANVMLLSVAVWSGGESMASETRSFFHWVSALIALPAVAYAGQPFFRSAFAALRSRALNMDVPISLAVLLASGMSLLQTMRGGEHAYFDAAVALLFFLLIGRYLDRRMRAKACSAAEQLMILRAVAATVVDTDGVTRTMPIQAVLPGMHVAVAAGDRIPVDGCVRAGKTEIDASLITGESQPAPIGVGDAVFAGSINLSAPLEIETTATDSESLLAEIVGLMEAAEQGRARYVRLADRFARLYAPVVHILAAATFLGWFVLGEMAWDSALMIAVAVLIITCPCALGLAVPVVQVVASGRLLKKGVLLKSPDGLERLAEADFVVFDKTGTLTLGRPVLTNKSDVCLSDLRLAASLARASRHPISRALVDAAGIGPAARDVEEAPGLGLRALVEGQEVRLGSAAWCEIEAPNAPNSGSMLWLTQEGAAPVCFQFKDELRPDSIKVVRELRSRGLEVALLSGDRIEAVAPIAAALGIDDWRGECRPKDKVRRLEALAAEGRNVLMVGDGLNDAPALAAAFVSASPAAAADVSQTAADFVFQGDGLTSLLDAFAVAKMSRRLVLQNFGLALAYNVVAVPLAVVGLVTPLIAAIAMSSSSLIVTLNSMRLKLDGGKAGHGKAGQ